MATDSDMNIVLSVDSRIKLMSAAASLDATATSFEPPKTDDSRAPCPALNALANHRYLQVPLLPNDHSLCYNFALVHVVAHNLRATFPDYQERVQPLLAARPPLHLLRLPNLRANFLRIPPGFKSSIKSTSLFSLRVPVLSRSLSLSIIVRIRS